MKNRMQLRLLGQVEQISHGLNCFQNLEWTIFSYQFGIAAQFDRRLSVWLQLQINRVSYAKLLLLMVLVVNLCHSMLRLK
jgi:hypothetical protein